METAPPSGIQTPANAIVQRIEEYEAMFPAPMKRKLIVITHGLTRQDDWEKEGKDAHPWVEIMKSEIEDRLGASSEWQVESFYWDSRFRDYAVIGPLLAEAESVGKRFADEVIVAGEKEWEEIHFIGHSAGANVINSAAGRLRSYPTFWDTTIQTTFLDPFLGDLPFGKKIYYGSSSDWSDHYFS